MRMRCSILLITCFLNEGVLPPAFPAIVAHHTIDYIDNYYYLDENCHLLDLLSTPFWFNDFWSSVRIVQAFKVEPTH